MKTIGKNALLRMAMAALAIVMVSQLAAAQLMLDDFSTGPYHKTLSGGYDGNIQFGSMAGGSRATNFYVPSEYNPFGQPNSFRIRPATRTAPNALVFNAGYKSEAYLEVFYGYSAPMTLNLAPEYDRIRVKFDGTDQILNFIVTAFSNHGSMYSQIGCNLVAPAPVTPFTVDLPFSEFTPGSSTSRADFSDIDYLWFIFGKAQGEYNSGEDWAVTYFQAIPTGAPPADITCHHP